MNRVRSVSGAASARVAERLAAAPAYGSILHVGRDAVYVEVGDDCLGVLSRNAVHVPCAILTALSSLSELDGPGSCRPGDHVEVGHGRLTIGGVAVSVARTVPTTAPSLADPAEAHAVLRGALPNDLGDIRAELPNSALADLSVGAPRAVAALLGRGSGLTPLGDDVLAGWLVTAQVSALSAYDDLRAEVGRLARTRTTTLSAALLDCARHGEALPQFRRLLFALDTGSTSSVSAALRHLLTVGHTSGAGMALGCLLALEGNTS